MKRNQIGKRKGWKTVMLSLLVILGFLILFFMFLRHIGKQQLQKNAGNELPDLSATDEADRRTGPNWQEGWVEQDGQLYTYNKDILTFLFMGIDKDREVIRVAEGTDGGQADALFLFVLNPHDKSLSVISINRNTMTDIQIYDENGDYVATANAQIAIQHGFGDGMEESCEYQIRAVRNLLYQLPIHGYCALHMDAVTDLTDLLGGIKLTAIEDVYSAKQDQTLGQLLMREGDTVLLDGRLAYSYVRYRNEEAPGSADQRLARQQQFLTAALHTAKEEVKKDLTLPVQAYRLITSQMVTNISVDEVAYLAGIIGDYSFQSDHFYSLPGDTVLGEEYEEFHVDDATLRRLILELFYEPVADERDTEAAR